MIQHGIVCLLRRLKMIARQGRFVEYSVFGKETSVDWTIISDAKGTMSCRYSEFQLTWNIVRQKIKDCT